MTEPLAHDSSPMSDSSSIRDGAAVPDTTIPDAETPVSRCPYCSRPFRTEQACTLHLGDSHRGEWTDDERAAYEAAADEEALYVLNQQENMLHKVDLESQAITATQELNFAASKLQWLGIAEDEHDHAH